MPNTQPSTSGTTPARNNLLVDGSNMEVDDLNRLA
jgi:hypothetical protein